MGVDGSLYFDTNIPFIFSPIGKIDYRTVRVLADQHGSDLRLQYERDAGERRQCISGVVPVRQSDAACHRPRTGRPRHSCLPSGADGMDPIRGRGRDTFYLPVGVRALFGGKTTRIYTMRGGDSTIRTWAGLRASTP